MTESTFPGEDRQSGRSLSGEKEAKSKGLDAADVEATDLDEDIAMALENQVIGHPEVPDGAQDPPDPIPGWDIRAADPGLPWLDRGHASAS